MLKKTANNLVLNAFFKTDYWKTTEGFFLLEYARNLAKNIAEEPTNQFNNDRALKELLCRELR